MPNPTGIAPWDRLFPDGVAITIAGEPERTRQLGKAEHACIAGAVETRQREFTAGRNCLHRCLKVLGLEIHPPILMGDLRQPLLPTGYVGTVSHCKAYCVAAVGPQSHFKGIGLDVEHNSPLEPGLAELICTREELSSAKAFLNHLPNTHRQQYPDPGKLIFSIKESFYKAYFPQVKAYFDFMDVNVRLDLENGSGQLQFLQPVGNQSKLDTQCYNTRFTWDDQYVYSAISIMQ